MDGLLDLDAKGGQMQKNLCECRYDTWKNSCSEVLFIVTVSQVTEICIVPFWE